jgi:hypothetical protein
MEVQEKTKRVKSCFNFPFARTGGQSLFHWVIQLIVMSNEMTRINKIVVVVLSNLL